MADEEETPKILFKKTFWAKILFKKLFALVEGMKEPFAIHWSTKRDYWSEFETVTANYSNSDGTERLIVDTNDLNSSTFVCIDFHIPDNEASFHIFIQVSISSSSDVTLMTLFTGPSPENSRNECWRF